MGDDVLHRGYDGPLAPGDYLVFDNVGGYSLVLKPPFIFPAAPVLAWSGEGEAEVLRRAERYEDVFGTFPT
jgi:diaminopimelate decarboxylase